jgi:uncharacterized membrane protein YbhN (UPF0104 family)
LETQVLKKYIKFFIKVAITALALFFVSKEINVKAAFDLMLQVNWLWLMLAFALFNLSKIASAIRLNAFFGAVPVILDRIYNLKLYYVGMFYNLFLPGSIGGDGYKVYLINKEYKTGVKPLISASLLDRLSGLISLSFLAGILLVFSHHTLEFAYINQFLIASILLVFPLFFLLTSIVFKRFIPVFWKTSAWSMLVQTLQVVCAICLLQSLSIQSYFIEYLAIFLISSVVSVLPLTVGGVGARELVFILGYQYLPIDKTLAVSFSLLFFAITASSSIIGAFVSLEKQPVAFSKI